MENGLDCRDTVRVSNVFLRVIISLRVVPVPDTIIEWEAQLEECNDFSAGETSLKFLFVL